MGALVYTSGLSLSTATVVGLYLLFTGSGESFNPGLFLQETSPYIWAMMGIGMCIGFSVIGAGWWVHLRARSKVHLLIHLLLRMQGESSSLVLRYWELVCERPELQQRISLGETRHGDVKSSQIGSLEWLSFLQHYLLRSSGNLWCHYGHRLFC